MRHGRSVSAAVVGVFACAGAAQGTSLVVENLTAASVPRHNAGVATHDGKLYLWGGISGSVRTDRAEVYDAVADAWSDLADCPVSRSGMGNFALNGKIYSLGGEGTSSGSFNNDVRRYHPDNDAWETMNAFPVNVMDPLEAVVDGRAYVMGGRQGYGQTYSDVREYDETSDSWVARAPMPVSTFLGGIATYDDKVYVFGGNHKTSESSNEFLRTVQVYDPALNTWAQIDNLPVAPLHATAFTGNNGIFVLLQQQIFDNGVAEPYPYALHYAPDNGQWTTYDFNCPSDVYLVTEATRIGSYAYLIGDTTDHASAYRMAVPEPAVLLLLGTGAVALTGVLRRRRMKGGRR